MKILVATTNYKSNRLEAITKNIINLYDAISQHSEITLLVPVDIDEEAKRFPFNTQSYASSCVYGSAWSLFKIIRQLVTYLKSFDFSSYDLCHLHVGFEIEIAALRNMVRRIPCPVLVTLWQPTMTLQNIGVLLHQASGPLMQQCLPHVLFNTAWWFAFRSYMFKPFACIQVASLYQRQQLLSPAIAEKIIQVPSGVPCPLPPKVPSEARKQKCFRIVYLGHHTPSKGVDILIKAMGMLKHRAFTLTLALSDRANHSVIAKMINKYGLEHCVEIKGKVDVHKEILKHDILVVPYKMPIGVSYYPNVVLESFATGVPVISTDWPIMRELLGEYSEKLLVPNGNALSLANKIQHFMDHPEEAQTIGQMLTKRYHSHFTLDLWARGQVDIYNRILNEASCILQPTV